MQNNCFLLDSVSRKLIIQLQHSLGKNRISTRGAAYLFDMLKNSCALVSSINLSENDLDDNCLGFLGRYIQSNLSLKRVDLSNSMNQTECNRITDEGIDKLVDLIDGNTSLSYIDLSFNKSITDNSYPALVKLVTRTSIIALNITGTSISMDHQKDINKLLAIPPEKRVVPILSSSKSASKITQN